jgi:hypothetical protein
MRALAYQVPQTQQALRHSHVVAAFGSGPHRIEVRRIDGSLNRVAPRPLWPLRHTPRLRPVRALRQP